MCTSCSWYAKALKRTQCGDWASRQRPWAGLPDATTIDLARVILDRQERNQLVEAAQAVCDADGPPERPRATAPDDGEARTERSRQPGLPGVHHARAAGARAQLPRRQWA